MHRLLCILFVLLSLPFTASGQDAITRKVPRGPAIDGQLNDDVWSSAIPITEFRQKEPSEGELATEQTTVRILYDDTQIYIGVQIIDSAPNEIRAGELRRDNTLESDDSFAVILDTFHDHRNAFLFRINPRGTRFDGLIRNENRIISADWDEQWTASAILTAEGWSAEIAIPFKILRFSGAAEQTWGLNFERVIKRKNEAVYWSGWDRDYAFTNVSQAGHLGGLQNIRQTERLRIRPYFITGIERFNAVTTPGRKVIHDIGIDDLKFSLTSNLTADLTVNPDFAQTEVDAQQVNLTRFSLFFPEKRQFFIEGADSLKMGVGLLHLGPPPVEMFYSRNIGLSETGERIPLIGGGKMTGKVGGFDLGILSVQTGTHLGRPGQNYAVGRIRKEILGRSYIGAIVTNRQGAGSWNRVAGADARFVLKRYLNIGALFAKSSETAGADKSWARQAGIEWRDDRIEAGINYINIDPNFNPGIGYVRRRDRMIGERISWRPRPGIRGIRQLELTPTSVTYHDSSGVLQSRQSRMQVAASFQSGDRIEMDVSNVVERLPRRFNIGPGVTLPAGAYQWNESVMTFRSYNGRKVSGTVGFNLGDFYDGFRHTLNFAGELRPNKNLSFSPTYNYNNVDLAEGSFNTHLAGLRSNVSFTASLLTSAYLQYTSAGQLAALQLRLNYIFRTIDNFFIVYNETRYTEGAFNGKSNRSLVLKVTYSLHR